MRELAPELLQTAKTQRWAPHELLATLVREEIASREASNERARLKAAGFPELAGAAKEGLLALSVGVGLGVLGELMAEEVCEVVGPKGKHDPDRAAVRHGRGDPSPAIRPLLSAG